MTENIYKKVDSIIFGIFSPEMIKKMACAKVVTPELYDKEGYPVDGGLMDTRLGIIDPGLRCKTCGGKLKECTGHFGYIELARPVIHVKFAPIILNLLRSSCRECGKILCPEPKVDEMIDGFEKIERERGLESKRAATNKFVLSLKNVKKCPHCKSKQYKITIDKPTTFLENDKRISPIEVKARLEKIPNKDLMALGLSYELARPEWTIQTLLMIPPVTMRPSITLESGERSEDDLTHKLSDIVRINQRLFENINAGAPEIIIEDLWDLLQYHITTYFDNSVVQIPPARHRSGQPLKTLTERIKSKEGRFRHNLAGKRVNFAARTVISPDPKIQFNEVGVPIIVAMELTIPEKVTEWNIKRLKEFIKRGPENYPGANYVVRPDGVKKKITEETQETLMEELEHGYSVERHLMDGDVALFNRQPSLHKMSLMCHKIIILPGKSFRLNPSVCNPYNADFDGDEMNLHIPQTEEARAEAEILMQVQTQMITPKNGLNIIGCIEDSVTGNYLLTKNVEMPREEAVQLLMNVGVEDFSRLENKKIITGKEIFSVLIPEDFDFIGNSKMCRRCDKCLKRECKHDAYVLIKKGKLLSGVIDKNSIGEDNGELLKSLHGKYGADIAIDILCKIFKLGIETLLKTGFTATISDSDLPQEIIVKSKELLKAAEKKVQVYIEEFTAGKIEALPSKTKQETVELKILGALNNVRNEIGKLVEKEASDANPTVVMIRAGAKGTMLNLVQMAICVGQQALRGKRIEKGYNKRTLTIFDKNELSADAKGFIKEGFKQGLSPYEFFFGAMTGRDSLMDTALRTPKSGYLYRRLANALQDLKVEYDYTVRDANKTIIQFRYGDDDIDVSKSEGGKINVKKIVKNVVGEKYV